jgi:hypothetical protein
MKRLFSFVLLVVVSSLICGCATMPPSPTTTAGIPLQEICKKYNVQWQFDSVTQVVLLDYKDNKAKALIGSPIVLIGQQKITLGSPLLRINSTIYVPSDFESKIIGPFGGIFLPSRSVRL